MPQGILHSKATSYPLGYFINPTDLLHCGFATFLPDKLQFEMEKRRRNDVP